jgi:diacylglycerol kinase (ATP)
LSRVLLIANPIAARTSNNTRQRVVEFLARAGWQVEAAVTASAGDAREMAREGVASGVDAIAVFGGDGTTMQAVAGMLGSQVPLVLIPGGTGNLLAGNLRLPSNPIQAARVLLNGRRRVIDLGRVALPDGEHYFGVACGAGVDAQVMGQTKLADKRRWGIGAYWASTIRALPTLKSSICTVTVDDVPMEVKAALVLIMNCGEMIPPLVRIRPEINPEDGLLDMVSVAADTPWEGIRGLLRVVFEGRREEIRASPHIRYARGTRFTVTTDVPLPVQFDGDPVGTTPFTAEVVPAALTVMVSRN